MKQRSTSRALYDRRIPIKLKRKIYRTPIRLVMLYGIECWIVKKQLIHKMSIDEMRMLRQISVNIKIYKIRNKEICLKIRLAPIDEKMGEKCLRWFDQVQRRMINAPMRKSELIKIKGMIKA